MSVEESVERVYVILEKQGTGLGFTIRGGTDSVHVGDDTGIYVTSIKSNGAAARSGLINPGDKILEIDGHDLRSVSHNEAVQYFHQTSDRVVLLIDKGAEDRYRGEQQISLNGSNVIPPVPLLPPAPLLSSSPVPAKRRVRLSFWIPMSILVIIVGIPSCYYIYKRFRR